MTRRLHLDGRQYGAILALCALLLLHLAFGTELLEHHFRVAAFVRVGVVEAHFGCVGGREGGRQIRGDVRGVWVSG